MQMSWSMQIATLSVSIIRTTNPFRANENYTDICSDNDKTEAAVCA